MTPSPALVQRITVLQDVILTRQVQKNAIQEAAWRAGALGEIELRMFLEKIILKTLSEGKIVSRQKFSLLEIAFTEPNEVRYENGLYAYEKQTPGPHTPTDKAEATNPKAEVLCYRFSRMLKLDLVPITVERDHHGEFASYQIEVRDVRDGRFHYDMKPSLLLNWYDYLTAESDRHIHNFFLNVDDDHAIAIDNSKSFRHTSTCDLYLTQVQKAEEIFTREWVQGDEELPVFIDSLRGMNEKEFARLGLQYGLSNAQIQAVLERKNYLLYRYDLIMKLP